LDGLIQWGLPIVLWVQTLRTPFLDLVFPAINFLGEVNFYTVLLPLLYWCIDKDLGRRYGMLFIFSTYVNIYLKDLFNSPRPYEVDTRVYAPSKEITRGIPSFHTQGSVVTWGYLASQFKSRWLWVLAFSIPLLIAFGRMYVGLHFPQDVIAGAVIGIALLGGCALVYPMTNLWFKEHSSLAIKLTLAIVAPLALAATHLTPDAGTSTGTLLGFGVGIVLEGEFVHFNADGKLWQRAARLAFGGVILLALQQGIKLALPEAGMNNFIRYGIIGFWLGLGAPWAFVKLTLAGQKPTPN
jgi:membrane-associated phospholipid phosphatase